MSNKATDKQIVTMMNHDRAQTSWVVRAKVDVYGRPSIAQIARIITVRPKDGAGRLRILVSDWGPEGNDRVQHQYGWAGGYGYNKLDAATDGMAIGGKLMDHGGHNLRDTVREMGFRMFGDMCA